VLEMVAAQVAKAHQAQLFMAALAVAQVATAAR
jgi:hypothetical protein